MVVDPKTVTVFLDANESGKKRMVRAIALAHRWNAHLVGIHVVFAGVAVPPSASFARGEKAIDYVLTELRQRDSAAEDASLKLSKIFREMCAGSDVAGEFRKIGRGQSAREAIFSSLHTDLVIVGYPEPHGLPDDMSPEDMLLASGVPLLIVPNAWKGETIGERILIGWNATRQARRAISDSMTFLVGAKSVIVLVIDPLKKRWHGQKPGAEIVQQLIRHDVHLRVEQMESNGSPIGEVILRFALESATDLLVVGAYSRARLRELLLGGVTRTLLAQMPVPVLISR